MKSLNSFKKCEMTAFFHNCVTPLFFEVFTLLGGIFRCLCLKICIILELNKLETMDRLTGIKAAYWKAFFFSKINIRNFIRGRL